MSWLKRETKKEFGQYLLDVSKFIVAGAIIDNVFNGSGISVVWAFACAALFLVIGLVVTDRIGEGE
jgi:hypothetical protein